MRPFKSALALVALAASAGLGPRADEAKPVAPATEAASARAQAVTVVPAREQEVVRQVLVAGTLIARDEVLVSPKIDGLSVVELLVDEGAMVREGQVLARLDRSQLEVQLAQNAAALARNDAAIAQATANVAEAEANKVQAAANLQRSETLKKTGFSSQELIDQRVMLARTTAARVNAAKDALAAARADRAATEAARRDIELKLARADIVAPRAGLVSRRAARLGSIAAMSAEPMFRIIANGAVELEAEAAESELGLLRPGMPVLVSTAGLDQPIIGSIRLISPEIDRTTRFGKIRIALPQDAQVSVGGFARGAIEAERRRAVALPISAVAYGANGATVQVVVDGRVSTRPVKLGLAGGGVIEIVSGVKAGEMAVAKAGVFVRDGDLVRAVPAAAGPQP